VQTIAETFPIYANVCNVLWSYPELHYKVTAFLLKYVLRSSSDCDFMLYIKSYSAEFCIFAEDRLHLGNLKQASLRSICAIFATDI